MARARDCCLAQWLASVYCVLHIVYDSMAAVDEKTADSNAGDMTDVHDNVGSRTKNHDNASSNDDSTKAQASDGGQASDGAEGPSDKQDHPTWCDVCQRLLNGRRQWEDHVIGKKHCKNLKWLRNTVWEPVD